MGRKNNFCKNGTRGTRSMGKLPSCPRKALQVGEEKKLLFKVGLLKKERYMRADTELLG